jgi:hypothetical protein
MTKPLHEAVRQHRVWFEQQRQHDEQWFRLRLTMGYCSVVLLPFVLALSGYVLYKNDQYPYPVVISAGSVLFVDVIAMLLGVWKITLAPTPNSGLRPTMPLDDARAFDGKPHQPG